MSSMSLYTIPCLGAHTVEISTIALYRPQYTIIDKIQYMQLTIISTTFDKLLCYARPIITFLL